MNMKKNKEHYFNRYIDIPRPKKPVPEKTIYDEEVDNKIKRNATASLDEFVSKTNNPDQPYIPPKPKSSPSSPQNYGGNNPDPLKHLGDHIFDKVKEAVLPSNRNYAKDSLYKFLRKRIIRGIFGAPGSVIEEKMMDVVAVVGYRVIDDFLTKKGIG